MRNEDIRTAMLKYNLPIWRVAEVLGVHFNTLRYWLRKEDLEPEKRQRIITAVQIAKEKLESEEGREI